MYRLSHVSVHAAQGVEFMHMLRLSDWKTPDASAECAVVFAGAADMSQRQQSLMRPLLVINIVSI